MILILHILIALGSIVAVSLAYIKPTLRKVTTTYVLTGLTIASGTYLTILSPAHILQTCISGLAYLAVVSLGLVLTHIKLVKLTAAIERA